MVIYKHYLIISLWASSLLFANNQNNNEPKCILAHGDVNVEYPVDICIRMSSYMAGLKAKTRTLAETKDFGPEAQQQILSDQNAIECKYRKNLLILAGPPGTGKTTLARHLVKLSGSHAIKVKASDLINEFQGSGAMSIKKIFETANDFLKKNPTQGVIIIIEEVDAIACVDSQEKQKDHANAYKTLNTSLDDHLTDQRILVIGLTNHVDKCIDEFCDRGVIIRMESPSLVTKRAILQDAVLVKIKKLFLDSYLRILQDVENKAHYTAKLSCFFNNALKLNHKNYNEKNILNLRTELQELTNLLKNEDIDSKKNPFDMESSLQKFFKVAHGYLELIETINTKTIYFDSLLKESEKWSLRFIETLAEKVIYAATYGQLDNMNIPKIIEETKKAYKNTKADEWSKIDSFLKYGGALVLAHQIGERGIDVYKRFTKNQSPAPISVEFTESTNKAIEIGVERGVEKGLAKLNRNTQNTLPQEQVTPIETLAAQNGKHLNDQASAQGGGYFQGTTPSAPSTATSEDFWHDPFMKKTFSGYDEASVNQAIEQSSQDYAARNSSWNTAGDFLCNKILPGVQLIDKSTSLYYNSQELYERIKGTHDPLTPVDRYIYNSHKQMGEFQDALEAVKAKGCSDELLAKEREILERESLELQQESKQLDERLKTLEKKNKELDEELKDIEKEIEKALQAKKHAHTKNSEPHNEEPKP